MHILPQLSWITDDEKKQLKVLFEKKEIKNVLSPEISKELDELINSGM